MVTQPYQESGPTVSDQTPYFLMLGRMMRAAGRRVGTADVEDLALLIGVRADLDRAIQAAVDGLRDRGATWQLIGDATGTTKQAAIGKWNRKPGR
jgi:hypothetical protein